MIKKWIQRQFYFSVVPMITKKKKETNLLENFRKQKEKYKNIKTNIQMCFYNKQIKFQFTFLKILQFNLPDIF